MNKIAIIGLILLISLSNYSKADEGMWLPSLIKKQVYSKMVQKGLKLSAEDIYDVNNASLKDAICGFGDSNYPTGFWCTGEVISKEGLILTNHHCGYDAIQSHSSISHDYLTNGFWAKNKSEELSNEDISVSFLVRMDDISEKILSMINDTMSEINRNAKINEISEFIEKEASQNGKYNASVKSMLNGNQYFLLIYETYTDIRLVGSPPSSIGKFGGDIDNWMWPRHTGDFCLFRIYTAPDGSPANYSPNNIPLVPKHSLPISIKGIKEGDFSMILGFPGSTERYLSSYGVSQTVNINNPAAIKIRTKKLEIIKEFMDTEDKIRIQYSSKFASTSNYWKYYIGQNNGLNKLNVYDEKLKLENEIQSWVDSDSILKNKYSNAIYQIESAYNFENNFIKVNQYINEGIFQGAEIIIFPYQALYLYDALMQSPDNKELIKVQINLLKEHSVKYFKDYHKDLDKKLFIELLQYYYHDIDKEYHFDFFTKIEKKYKSNIAKFAEHLFEKSIFADSVKFNNFINNPTLKVIEKDPAFIVTKDVLKLYFELYSAIEESELLKENGMRLFVASMIEKFPEKAFYPDANSTLRLTYGSVGSYKPMDAVNYKHFTTIKGIIEKEDSTNEDFIVPKKLKELYAKKDYGQYSENNDLMVCFITNNDITGGNSGSPAINANGELIGTAFDGNWEGMSGDIKFENDIQKTIICDIRYILFIIDKFADAQNIINELDIIK